MRTFLCPHNIHPLNPNPLTLRSARKNTVQSICDITNWTHLCARDDLKRGQEDKHRPAFSGPVTRCWTLTNAWRPNESRFQEEWGNSSLTTGLSRNTWHKEFADTICLLLLWPPSPLTPAGPLRPAGVQMKAFRRFRNDITLMGELFRLQSPDTGDGWGLVGRWFSLRIT